MYQWVVGRWDVMGKIVFFYGATYWIKQIPLRIGAFLDIRTGHVIWVICYHIN